MRIRLLDTYSYTILIKKLKYSILFTNIPIYKEHFKSGCIHVSLTNYNLIYYKTFLPEKSSFTVEYIL